MIDREDFPIFTEEEETIKLRLFSELLRNPEAFEAEEKKERERRARLFQKYVVDKSNIDLAALSVDELLERFEVIYLVSEEVYDGSDEEGVEEFGVCQKALQAVKKELKARGHEALRALQRFYDHYNFGLRVEAAALSYRVAPESARRCLEHIRDLQYHWNSWEARAALEWIDSGEAKSE